MEEYQRIMRKTSRITLFLLSALALATAATGSPLILGLLVGGLSSYADFLALDRGIQRAADLSVRSAANVIRVRFAVRVASALVVLGLLTRYVSAAVIPAIAGLYLAQAVHFLVAVRFQRASSPAGSQGQGLPKEVKVVTCQSPLRSDLSSSSTPRS